MAKKGQNLTNFLEKSKGMICDRFDALEDTANIVIFETPKEVGIYNYTGEHPTIEKLRTKVSGDLTLQFMASMSKGTFYRENMLTNLCAHDVKRGRPINYYGI